MLPKSAAFGRDLDGIGRDREPGQTERLEMRVPGRAIGEVLARMLSEQLDHRPCQVALVHVGECSGVEDVVVVASAQQLEKVAPTLGEEKRQPTDRSRFGRRIASVLRCQWSH